MSDRIKEIILKTLLVIWTILFFSIFPGMIFIGLLFEENTAYIIFTTIWNSIIVSSILFVVLRLIFGGLKQKPVKAETVLLPFEDYISLEYFLDKSLTNNFYVKQKKLSFDEKGNVAVYIKSTKLWTLDCFAIIRVVELSDETLEIVNDKITEILTEYYKGKTITDTVNMISVFCVNRITPTFQKLVNSNIQQGFKNGRLPVGISFGGKKIYIAKQKDGFAIAHYKKLRKEFLDVMHLSEDQIMKNSTPKRNAK